MKRKAILTLGLLMLNPLAHALELPAQGAFFNAPQANKNTLSFRSDYFGNTLNNRALATFGTEVMGLNNYAFDYVASRPGMDTTAKRALLFLGDSVVNILLSASFHTTYHEFGHWGRAKALGLNPHYDKRPNNFFGFFVEKLGSPLSGEAVMFSYNNIKFKPKNEEQYFTTTNGIRWATPRTKLMIFAAGINNQMYFAGRMADQIATGRGHVMDLVPYLEGKLSTIEYSSEPEVGNDLTSVVSAYKAMGINVRRRDLDQANIVSLLLSSSTYAYGFGLMDFMKTGVTTLKPFEWYGFLLPDVENYMTTRGLSYKVKSAYRLDETLRFPFSVEFVAKGKSQVDPTIGVEKVFRNFHNVMVKSSVTARSNFNFAASIHVPVADRFEFSAGFERDNVKNFEGERNITTLQNGPVNNYVWAGVSVKF